MYVYTQTELERIALHEPSTEREVVHDLIYR